jgi:hypothetical protein
MKRLLFALLLLPSVAHAVVLDGRLDAEYGPAIVLQTTQTSGGKSTPGFGGPDSLATSFGSELDGAYGFVAGGALHVFIAGNLLASVGEFDHRWQLHLFVDTRTGGQHSLRADNADAGYWADSKLNTLAGLTFDDGFAADFWLDLVVLDGANPVHAYAAELLDAGGGVGGFLGSGSAGGPGDLTGGANPGGSGDGRQQQLAGRELRLRERDRGGDRDARHRVGDSARRARQPRGADSNLRVRRRGLQLAGTGRSGARADPAGNVLPGLPGGRRFQHDPRRPVLHDRKRRDPGPRRELGSSQGRLPLIYPRSSMGT